MKTSTSTFGTRPSQLKSQAQVHREEYGINSTLVRRPVAPRYRRRQVGALIVLITPVSLIILCITLFGLSAWRNVTDQGSSFHSVTCKGEIKPTPKVEIRNAGAEVIVKQAYAGRHLSFHGDWGEVVNKAVQLNGGDPFSLNSYRVPNCH